jgi:hypothetical protein
MILQFAANAAVALHRGVSDMFGAQITVDELPRLSV